jgi:hypothetical protein
MAESSFRASKKTSMKTLKLSLLAAAAMLAISCSKTETPKPSINGLWIGKYSSGATAYPIYGYAFLFRPDGTVRVFNDADTTVANKAEGTYAILGSTITTNYKFITGGQSYSTSAKINENYTFMEGTWGSGTNVTSGGNFFIYK